MFYYVVPTRSFCRHLSNNFQITFELLGSLQASVEITEFGFTVQSMLHVRCGKFTILNEMQLTTIFDPMLRLQVFQQQLSRESLELFVYLPLCLR